jgi:hypothetical protein
MRRLARRSSALLAAFISSLLTLLVASITPVWSVFVFSSFEAHIHNGVLWESLAWLPHNLLPGYRMMLNPRQPCSNGRCTTRSGMRKSSSLSKAAAPNSRSSVRKARNANPHRSK